MLLILYNLYLINDKYHISYLKYHHLTFLYKLNQRDSIKFPPFSLKFQKVSGGFLEWNLSPGTNIKRPIWLGLVDAGTLAA